jgi:hypothetical protein
MYCTLSLFTLVLKPRPHHHPPRLISDFLADKKVSEQEFRLPHQNHLTSINYEIDRRDDGHVLIARELSDALRAKICWGILTPWTKRCSILACISLRCLKILSPFWTTSLRCCDSSPTGHNRSGFCSIRAIVRAGRAKYHSGWYI